MMSGPLIQHYRIDNFTFKDGTGPTSIHLAFLDINPTVEKVALVLTCFRGRLDSTLTFRHGALKNHRVIVVALFGNGESSSPSNMANFPPLLDYQDCVRAQHQLISSHLNIQAIEVVVGFSMGGQCSYYWTLLYPEMVRNAVIVCSSARTSRHNYQFLEGPKAALEFSADYRAENGSRSTSKALGGLQAFGKAYSAWLTSPEWFEEEMYKSLGYDTLADWDEHATKKNYHNWHPDDLLSMVGMWQRGNVTSILGDASLQDTLSRIKARVLVMPCSTDQYFRWEASEKESRAIAGSIFKIIPSAWGHLAGIGYNTEDKEFINQAIAEFLIVE
jgi:homoserine O-acetyltransferase